VLAGYTPAEIVATSFIVVEAMSVLENAVKVGLPVPGFIVETLRQAQDRLGYDTQRKAGKE
jgi:phage-related holin